MTHAHDLSRAVFRKSRRSEQANTCVEVAQNIPGIVAVRDSKETAGPALVFTPGEWRSFIGKVKAATP